MPRITYIEHNGTTHSTEVSEGSTVMQGARDLAVPGIDADCGGCCACGTCHVFVEADWENKLPARSDSEVAMLESIMDAKPNSRLSCQINVTPELDGLVVHIPLVVR